MHVLITFSPDLWSVCGRKNLVKLDNYSAECQSATGETQLATAAHFRDFQAPELLYSV